MIDRKFAVGARVKVVANMYPGYNTPLGALGTVTGLLTIPNPLTGVYPGVFYKEDASPEIEDNIALEGELELA